MSGPVRVAIFAAVGLTYGAALLGLAALWSRADAATSEPTDVLTGLSILFIFTFWVPALVCVVIEAYASRPAVSTR